MLAIMNRPLYLYEEKIISSEIPALIDSESFLKTALNSKHVNSFLMWQNWRHFVPMKKGRLFKRQSNFTKLLQILCLHTPYATKIANSEFGN